MIVLLLLLSSFGLIHTQSIPIKIYGDVQRDQRFFEEIFPRLIDNIGGFLSIEYTLLGSGVYSVPQMCALSLMGSNNFLQAQYLKCEAAGVNAPETCLCLVGMDYNAYRSCVYGKGWLARDAYNRYNAKADNPTPIVESGKLSMSGADHTFIDYLEKICSLYVSKPPITCSQPNQDIVRRGAVRFDCNRIDPMDMAVALAPKTKLRSKKTKKGGKKTKMANSQHQNKKLKKP